MFDGNLRSAVDKVLDPIGVVLWRLKITADALTILGILCVALYSFFASASTSIDESQALKLAESDLGFAAGPASAQMMWRGWGSKPVWRLLVYSQEPQPEFRAAVIIDAGNGKVLEKVVEENPEDWS